MFPLSVQRRWGSGISGSAWLCGDLRFTCKLRLGMDLVIPFWLIQL